jgi:porin
LPYGKYALGAWIYTANFEDILEVVPNDPDDDEDDEPLMRDGNKGIYAFMEQQIIREKEDPDQGLALFIRLGWANPNFNDISVYTGGGLVYTGLIPTREQDQVGFAVAAVHVGNKFKQANYEAETPVKDEEVNLEFTYRIQVMPWFALQPNFQYVINPGLNPLLQDAWVIGSRWEFSF